MKTLLAKAELRAHVLLGIATIGEKHGARAMQQTATVFNEIWEKEDMESPPVDARSPTPGVHVSP